MERLGIPKTKLGRVLGGNKNEDYKVSSIRASRFLNGNSIITIEKLNIICDFFDKPIEYFISDNSDNYIQTGNGIQNNIRENKNSKIINISKGNVLEQPGIIEKLSNLNSNQSQAVQALINQFWKDKN